MQHIVTTKLAQLHEVSLSFNLLIGSNRKEYANPITFRPDRVDNPRDFGKFSITGASPFLQFEYRNGRSVTALSFNDQQKFRFEKAIEDVTRAILNDTCFGEDAIYKYDDTYHMVVNQKMVNKYTRRVVGFKDTFIEVRPALYMEENQEVKKAIAVSMNGAYGVPQNFFLQLEDAEYLAYLLGQLNMQVMRFLIFNTYLQIVQMHSATFGKLVKTDSYMAQRNQEEEIRLEQEKRAQTSDMYSHEDKPDPVYENQGNIKRTLKYLQKEDNTT